MPANPTNQSGGRPVVLAGVVVVGELGGVVAPGVVVGIPGEAGAGGFVLIDGVVVVAGVVVDGEVLAGTIPAGQGLVTVALALALLLAPTVLVVVPVVGVVVVVVADDEEPGPT